MSKEQRQARRLPIVLEARWDGSTSGSEARITDIGVAGCYLDTIAPALPGDSVCLSLRLPNGRLATLTGIVAHYHEQTGFGIKFADLCEEQCEAIAALLETAAMIANPSTKAHT
jgi:hypothetical protein